MGYGLLCVIKYSLVLMVFSMVNDCPTYTNILVFATLLNIIYDICYYIHRCFGKSNNTKQTYGRIIYSDSRNIDNEEIIFKNEEVSNKEVKENKKSKNTKKGEGIVMSILNTRSNNKVRSQRNKMIYKIIRSVIIIGALTLFALMGPEVIKSLALVLLVVLGFVAVLSLVVGLPLVLLFKESILLVLQKRLDKKGDVQNDQE